MQLQVVVPFHQKVVEEAGLLQLAVDLVLGMHHLWASLDPLEMKVEGKMSVKTFH